MGFLRRHCEAEPRVIATAPSPWLWRAVRVALLGMAVTLVAGSVLAGIYVAGVTVYDPIITQGCVKIAEALPALGPITVQCMLKDNVPHFTEINARLGGGVPLGIAAGVDAPRWLLARSAGLEVEIPPLGTYQTGLYLTRFDDTFFVTEAQREQMASHRL